VNERTGQAVAGKFEFTYRDATKRQIWQTAKGTTKADAKAERAAMVARLRLGERVERTNLTVAEVARQWVDRGVGQHGRWDESTRERYDRIVRCSIEASPDPRVPPVGAVKLTKLTVDRVAAWSQANERVLAPTTASLALIALNQVCKFALRRGWLADNPVARLQSGEKPRWRPTPVRVLEGADLARVLEHAGEHRPLIEFLAYTGLRINEALGLRWQDIDFDAGLIRVRHQLSRRRELKRPKTDAGQRDVVMASSITRLLRRRWLSSAYKASGDFVFCEPTGRALDYREVGEGFQAAVKAAGLQGHGRLTLHSLRHGFASLLIAKGLNVVFVSHQLGHAKPTTTLTVYAHLFDQAEHAAAARSALQASYEVVTGDRGNSGGNKHTTNMEGGPFRGLPFALVWPEWPDVS
jgi:integrase